MTDPWVIATGAATFAGVAASTLAWRHPRAPRGEPWTLEVDRGQQLRLTNKSGRTAHDVELDLGDYPQGLTRNTGPWSHIEPGEAVCPLISSVGEIADPTIRVLWRARFRRQRWVSSLPR